LLLKRFRPVVEAASNAMVMINQAGEIVMVNAQTERAFGYPRGELLGQPVEILLPERFRLHQSVGTVAQARSQARLGLPAICG
jgi:PAS domain S-box-containing protein